MLVWKQGRKGRENESFTTTAEEFLKKLKISELFKEIEWIRFYTYARKAYYAIIELSINHRPE